MVKMVQQVLREATETLTVIPKVEGKEAKNVNRAYTELIMYPTLQEATQRQEIEQIEDKNQKEKQLDKFE